MKEVWTMLWMFIVIVVTLAIIVLIGPSVGRVIDEALMMDARYQAMELSGTLNGIQLAPEGTTSEYAIPLVDMEGCIKIYKTFVLVDLGRGENQAEIVHDLRSTTELEIPLDRMTIDCTKTEQKLIIAKERGKVTLSIAQQGGG